MRSLEYLRGGEGVYVSSSVVRVRHSQPQVREVIGSFSYERTTDIIESGHGMGQMRRK